VGAFAGDRVTKPMLLSWWAKPIWRSRWCDSITGEPRPTLPCTEMRGVIFEDGVTKRVVGKREVWSEGVVVVAPRRQARSRGIVVSVEVDCIAKQLLILLVSGPSGGEGGGTGGSTDETHCRMPRKFEIIFAVGEALLDKPLARRPSNYRRAICW